MTGSGTPPACRLASFIITAGAVVGASFCDPGSGWSKAWSDEFDENSLNPADWNVLVGGSADPGCKLLNDPACWACREAWCAADNVVVGNGSLKLVSQREKSNGHNYTSAGVTTRGKQHWSYAPAFRLCVSAMLPGTKRAAQGLWPAIWLMPDDDTCDPDEGEFDVLEMVNGDGTAWATYHWQTTFPKSNCSYPTGHEHVYTSEPVDNWDIAFHEYAVEHGPTYIAYVYDGKTVLNSSVADAAHPIFWPVPFYLFLNSAVGGGWPKSPNASTVFPTYFTIDYVRVTTKG